ncbi:hypothetical protein Dimus_024088 [Dionaea muscipula]
MGKKRKREKMDEAQRWLAAADVTEKRKMSEKGVMSMELQCLWCEKYTSRLCWSTNGVQYTTNGPGTCNKCYLKARDTAMELEREKEELERKNEELGRENEELERENEELERENEELGRENEELEREKEELEREKEELERKNEELGRENEELGRENEELGREKKELERKNEELERENEELERENKELGREKKELERKNEELERENEELKANVDFLRHSLPSSHDDPIQYHPRSSPLFCDVKLVASDDLPDAPVLANKFVLASRSPVFKAMLEIAMKESISGTIEISDITHDSLHTFVNYLYTADVCLDEKIARDLLVLAEKYQVKHLNELCQGYLVSNLNWDNSVLNYVFAYKHSVVKLLEASLLIITDNMDMFMNRDDYGELIKKDPSLVVGIWEAYTKKQVNIPSSHDDPIQYHPRSSPLFGDVTLVASDDSPDSPVPTNKFVLATHSSVFKAMLERVMEESISGTIKISDVIAYDSVHAFVNYLFTAHVCLHEKIARDLLILAEKYQVKHLNELCQKYLVSDLNWDNLVSLNWDNLVSNYVFAYQHSARKLLKASLSIITNNMDKFMNTEEYRELVKKDSSCVVGIFEAYMKKQVNIVAKKGSS